MTTPSQRPNSKQSRKPAAPSARPGEFELIAKYFAPLARAARGAAGLADDVAEIAARKGERLIVKTDAIVEGRHYLATDPADLVARKLLRVNLSDLAGKGARPIGYVVAAAFPDRVDEAWVADFARGLGIDQKLFGLSLLGGDTTATPGPATFAVTVFGSVSGRVPRRADAEIGDDIWLSGSLGDGTVGLLAATGRLTGVSEAARAELVDRYRLPRPRLDFGRAVLRHARASMDVSDGLVGDLQHICDASGVGARIEASFLPFSEGVAEVLAIDPALLIDILGGGDDYEILFTAARSKAGAIAKAAKSVGVPATRIGSITRGREAVVVDRRGQVIELAHKGYRHF